MLNASINFFLHVHDHELFGGNFFVPRIHVSFRKSPTLKPTIVQMCFTNENNFHVSLQDVLFDERMPYVHRTVLRHMIT